MTPETIMRGWCLALRDLCDQGADTASVTLADATLTYTPGEGATLVNPAGSHVLVEEWIDRPSYAVADGLPSLPEALAAHGIVSPRTQNRPGLEDR